MPYFLTLESYFIIGEANTVIDPGAVMVHLKRTHFTN